jgi:phosphoglucomutase
VDRAGGQRLLDTGLTGIERIPYERAVGAATVHRHDYVAAYVDDLSAVIDLETIQAGCGWVWIRWAGPASPTGWPRPSAMGWT